MGTQSSFVSYHTPLYLLVKRFFDVVLATMLLLALVPLFCLIGILIKLDSPGPILFIQERMGSQPHRLGRATIWIIRPFRMFKFRSMYCSSDELLHKKHIQSYIDSSPQGHDHIHDLKTPQDPRITRIGHLLRKTSLDELPQLWNVLIGDMSLVGPRPIPVYEFELYSEEAQKRFDAWQGMTGLWQVRGRCQLSFEKQIALDIEYTKKQSFWLDLKILLLTIPAVLFGRGAE